MEVESDEEDEKQEKAEEPPSQLDQDTQVQDMDEGSDDEEEGQKVPPPPETPMPPPLPQLQTRSLFGRTMTPKLPSPCLQLLLQMNILCLLSRGEDPCQQNAGTYAHRTP